MWRRTGGRRFALERLEPLPKRWATWFRSSPAVLLLCSLAALCAASDASAQEYRCSTVPGRITFGGSTIPIEGPVSDGNYLGAITAYVSHTQFSLDCDSQTPSSLIGSPLVVITVPGASVASSAGNAVIRLPSTNIGLRFNRDPSATPQYSAMYGGIMLKSLLFPPMVLHQGTATSVSAYSGETYSLNLVALGAIHDGERIPAGVIGQVILSNVKDRNNPNSYLKLYDIEFSGDLIAAADTCDVINTTVRMGTRELMGGVGASTPAVPFQIGLLKCPTDRLISYRIDPATSIVAPAPAGAGSSVMALDSSSSAAGVGIQLLQNDLTPHPLGTVVPLNVSVWSSSMAIPLNARYIKIAPLLVPGSANSSATITLSYQ